MSNQMLTDFLIQYQLQLSIEWDKGGGGSLFTGKRDT